MRRLAALVLTLGFLSACDSGPSGPGDLNGTVETPGPVLGGAVLEVVGKGITGFSGSGSTHAFFSPTGVDHTYRVVLIAEVPGPIQFRVSVQNVGAKKPAASVVNIVSGGDVPLPATSDYRVRFSKN